MAVPKHWTLLLALCALKQSSILLFLVISAEIWVCRCHLSKASILEDEIATPCMPRVQLSVLPLSGHWNVFDWNVGKLLMVQ